MAERLAKWEAWWGRSGNAASTTCGGNPGGAWMCASWRKVVRYRRRRCVGKSDTGMRRICTQMSSEGWESECSRGGKLAVARQVQARHTAAFRQTGPERASAVGHAIGPSVSPVLRPQNVPSPSRPTFFLFPIRLLVSHPRSRVGGVPAAKDKVLTSGHLVFPSISSPTFSAVAIFALHADIALRHCGHRVLRWLQPFV